MPSAEELQIAYKLIMDTKPDANPVISGEFSYLENDQTQKIVAPETIVNLPQEETPVVTNTVTPTNTVVPETNTVTPTTNTVAVTNTVVPETNTVTATTNTVDPVTTITVIPETNVTKTTNASLNFQVQIGAFRNNISVDRIASVYNINDDIRTDMHEGYTKFLIGSYSEYKGARDKRESVKGKVSGAFVTVYNNGKRITVQEALMISNQKWLR